jgi:cytochrome c oxidase subunit 1
MNNISFWVLLASFALLVTSLFMPGMPGGNGVGAGWTLYAPLTTKGTPGIAMDFAILSLHLAGEQFSLREPARPCLWRPHQA